MLVFLLACVGGSDDKPAAQDTAEAPTGTDPCGTYSKSQDGDGDGSDPDCDCDDNDASRFPGADEQCDGIDNDCDDVVDEDVTVTFYADADGDGFGDAGSSTEACEASPGWVENADDCDDADSTVFPAATEVCNDADDDCDGLTDEDLPTAYADADGDGWGDPDASTCGEGATNARDCDDGDPDEPVIVHVGESIQAAIDIARRCVFVEAGAFPEDLDLLDKDLILWGIDGPAATFVTGTGDAPVLRIAGGQTSDAYVGGFTLSGGGGERGADGMRRGGGLFVSGANPTLQDLVLTDNWADLGGGLYVENASPPAMSLVDARANTAGMGGGVYVEGDASVQADCADVVDNVADIGGGIVAIGAFTGEGLLVADNAASLGAGLYTEGSAAFASLLASTVAYDEGLDSVWVGDMASVALAQVIVAGNSSGDCIDGEASGSISVTESDVWGCAGAAYGSFADPTGMTGNVSLDPGFADPQLGDYTLAGANPCEGDGCGYTVSSCASR
jgi:hypothetical protein